MALGLSFCGCDSRSGGAQASAPAAQAPAESGPAASEAQAPARLVYPTDPAVYAKGVIITPNTPYATGGAITVFRVNPALPAGLSLNPATGVLSGTPTAVAAAAGYEVTGSNSAGSTSVTLTVTVNDQAPAAKPVVTLPPFVTESATGIAVSTQDLGKDMTYVWTVRGGSVSSGQGTPAITCVADGPGTLTASVTVANSGGSATGSAEAAVVPMPDATLSIPVAIEINGSKQASVPQQQGMTYAWTIVPGTGTATITAGQGSNAITFTAGRTPGTFQIQVKVQNQTGNYLTTHGTVKVQTGYL
jgi:hypothetical protein